MRKLLTIITLFVIPGINLYAQKDQSSNPEIERTIQRGNELYTQKQYEQAIQVYDEALKADPDNSTAKYNRALALQKQGKSEDAIKAFNDVAFKTEDHQLKSKSYYNKGVIYSGQKNLEESIEAYKDALRQNPDDKQARENLQKALLELKKKSQNKKDDKQKKQQQQKQQQKPQPKMNQKEAEQRLKLLEQKEKELQERLQKEKSKSGGGQSKDW